MCVRERESQGVKSLGGDSIHSALLKITLATHRLIKSIQSDVSWKTNVCHYSGTSHHPSGIHQDWCADESVYNALHDISFFRSY